MLNRRPLQDFITNSNQFKATLVLGTALALVGTLLGLLLALIGPIYTVALLIALAGAIWVLAGLENALWSVIAIITLLPFATLPFKIVLTPTFLDLAIGAVYFLYLMQWMIGERRRLTTTPVHPLIVLFIILTIFSFIAGLRYTSLTATTLRRFAELILGMALALVLVDVIRTYEQLRRFVLVIAVAGTLAAAIAIGLWLMPDLLAERILGRLAIIGYPDAGIIQYIEQNPELPERAIGTSVNPNSLGGLLVMVAALVAPQTFARHTLTGKRWHAWPVLLVLVSCLVLTFSRGSMLAFGAALIFIAILRYRKLLIVLAVIALVLLILPWSQLYIERFIEGFQGADLATQMRLGEYKDALTLIGRYPLLGVGFTGTPDIDIYLGASSVYLTIASNMGLLGVGAFLALMIAVLIYAWQARPHLDQTPGLYSIWLGLTAGLIGALINGIGDHYFFNLEFQHAVAVFWVFIGLILATTRIALENSDAQSRGTNQAGTKRGVANRVDMEG